MDSLRERALAWCREDRSLGGRALLLLYGGFLVWKFLDPLRFFTPIDFLNLGIHELGHVLCMPFGQWVGVAGGSAAQVLAPLYGVWQFRKQEDYFAAAFGFAWLGESLINLSAYIADARRLELPLANLFGGEPVHDWEFLLGSMRLLSSDQRIANGVRLLGLFSVLFFLYAGSWMLWQILRARAGGAAQD